MVDDVKSIEKMNFEQALAELETIVQSLESGSAPLEESITAYERGNALKKRCEETLANAKARIESITLNENGAPVTKPFDEQKG